MSALDDGPGATVPLQEYVAIVTGAGAGIGRAEARMLASRGASVVVNDVVRERADAVVTEIEQTGGEAVADYHSVIPLESGQEIVATAVDRFGKVSALVNNAGTVRPAEFLRLTPDRFESQNDVHLRGSMSVTRAVWPLMLEQGFGRVVMTSSSTALFSNHHAVAYGSAKAAVLGLMRALAIESEGTGIRVNAILPYATTDIRKDDHSPEMRFYEEVTSKFSLKHLGQPFDPQTTGVRGDPDYVAHMVAYLAGPECSVHGEAYSVWLGRFARVFFGVCNGVMAPEPAAMGVDWVASHLDGIRDQSSYTVPMSLYQENADAFKQLEEATNAVS
jgi:NAD(P)-dependent dehydrogenase (short-subunit alcohol dehydrogenase family)